MREIVLDTETTGLDPGAGDRIVEIGAVELWNHLPTGKTFHKYLNPERNMPDEAQAVHGLTEDFLKDKPVFSQIVDEFLEFIEGSKLVIHNASFDMKFINSELALVRKAELPNSMAIDTLAIARKNFPGSPASLDALCRRFNIDNSSRTLHGALLDCLRAILVGTYQGDIGGRVGDVMSSPVETIQLGSNIVEVAERMLQTNRRRFPVIDSEENLRGQISRRDLLRAVRAYEIPNT